MPDHAATPGEDPLEANPQLAAIFAGARQMQEKLMRENSALDSAWRNGTALEKIAEMRRQAKDDMEAMTTAAKQDQEDLSHE